MRHSTCFALATLMVLCSLTVGHTVPQLVNYQGVLTDGGGTPITVATTVEFRIWDMGAAGTELWMESQSVTPDANGLFNVLLGAVNPIPDTALAAAAAYLGMTISPDPEMSPRTQLVSVAYAFRPGTVDGASGGHITSKVSIGPGHTNTGIHAFIVGENSTAGGDWSSIGGGTSNQALADYATVSGGGDNNASGQWSTVGGGSENLAGGDVSTIGGGITNTASGVDATIGGGNSNLASTKSATVGGGAGNIATDTAATVGGGSRNKARGIYSVVAGGGGGGFADSNSASGDWSVIGGGRANTANDRYSTVGGGRFNTSSAIRSTVGGGDVNTAGGSWSTVGGGHANVASSSGSTVGGGSANDATGIRATVGGGLRNTASETHATVGGGGDNTASGTHATVGGGRNNHASGSFSVVAGGGDFDSTDGNFAIGEASAIPGGRRNIAGGEFSFAAGLRAQANHDGCFVWADSSDADYASTADDQFLIRANGGVGIGTAAPAAQLHVTSTGSDYGGAPGVNEVVAGFRQTTGTRHSAIAIDATTSHDAILYLAEDGVAKWGLRNDANDADKFQIRWHGGGSNTAYLTIESATGEVGIGTASPSERLHVVGNICYTGSIAACSDVRYKTDVTTLTNSLESVLQMRGVRYRWKQDEFPGREFDELQHLGFIAQDVEAVFPEMVLTDDNGYKSVDYGRLTPVLVEAIKEQQKTIDQLIRRVKNLERAM